NFGATHTINSRNQDPVAAIRELTGGNGADVVIEAVGRPETYEQAFYARDLAGVVGLVGVLNPDTAVALPVLMRFGGGGALKSSWYGGCRATRVVSMLVQHYLNGTRGLAGFVTGRIGIGGVEAACEKMNTGIVLRSVV